MRIAFLATGGALLAAGLMVFFTVQEKFIPPSDRFGLTRPFVDLWKLSLSRAFLPLFTMVFLVLTANLLLHPALPGLVAIARDGATTHIDVALQGGLDDATCPGCGRCLLSTYTASAQPIVSDVGDGDYPTSTTPEQWFDPTDSDVTFIAIGDSQYGTWWRGAMPSGRC